MSFPTTRFFVLLAIAALWPAHVEAADPTPQDAAAINDAQRALNAGDFDRTITLLTPLRTRYPTLGDIPRLLARAYFEKKQFPEARAAALEAIGTGRMTPDTVATLAQIDRERNDAVALLGAVRMLTVLDAANRDWRIIYGDLLAGARQYEEAAAVFRTLLVQTPNESPLVLRLANVLMQQRQLREAAATYETAWRLGATDAQVPRLIAGIWSEEGDFRQALLWAERAEKLVPQADPRLTLQMADLHFRLRQYDSAESYANRLADVADTALRAPARLILGQIAVARGDTETAMGHWRIAADSGYTGVDLLSHLAAYYYNKRDFTSAATYLERVVEAEDAASEERLRFLIVSCLQINDRKRAETYLQKYLERHGLSAEAGNLIKAWVHHKWARQASDQTEPTKTAPPKS